jgi:hypothetical protein
LELIKRYILQSITAASNNLRLTTHQLEALGLLKESLINTDDITAYMHRMKTITELSKLAIRLNEIYIYLTESKIDFFNFSDQFKEHSQYLINDLNHILEIDNPSLIKAAIGKLNGETIEKESEDIKINLTEGKTGSEQLIVNKNELEENNRLAENVREENDVFRSYENIILKPIKPIDTMLTRLAKNEVNYEDLSRFAEIMRMNGEISERNGFEIISGMHNIISKALQMIKSRELMPGKDVIDSIRACLIVIVAVVRGKDVDITNYLNKAENFEKEINKVNS